MATRTWVGGTSSVWSLAANWLETTVPISTDDVYIVSGSVDIIGEDESAVDLNSLTVGTQYSGTIGTSGTKMQINATNFIFSGTGATNYIEGQFTTVTVQNTSTNTAALNLSGASDTITTLRILGGRGGVNIASSCNLVTTVEQIGAEGVTTNIATGTTIGASCELRIDSGRMELNEAIPTITVFGGELEAGLASGTVTALDIYGGRVRWNPTATCVITTLNLYNGLFDSRDSLSPTFTVTNTTVHEGGIIDERSGLENATWTSPLNLEGGEVRYDSGRQVTIS
jgi:hypothetical protein